jgi:superfamily II DNA/RNA helicase
MNFKDLKLIEPILKALKDQNYIEPTEIQGQINSFSFKW